MTIEDRISRVDLNSATVNTDYRAALHQKLSGVSVNFGSVRSLFNDDLVLPLSASVTRKLYEIQSWVFNNSNNRELISLSPLGIFGIDQILTKTSPLKIAHIAGQPVDVVADPTIQLVAETYRRRRSKDQGNISLGAFHKCTRLQRYTDSTYKSIFEMFGTVDSRSRDPSNEFEIDTICRLIDSYTALIEDIYPGHVIDVIFGNLGVAKKVLLRDGQQELSSNFTEKIDLVAERLPTDLRGVLPIELLIQTDFIADCDKMLIKSEVAKIGRVANKLANVERRNLNFSLDRIQGLGHYNGLVFMLFANGVDLVDGGTVDWVQSLSSNTKERTVVSGMGTQLLAELTLAQK